jgi:hypothetical protein
MLLKFLKHGRGSGAKAAAYLIDDKDHQNIERAGITILRGDPRQFAAIADSLPFRQRYTSAVIAWHIEDQPTPEQINSTLDQFEQIAFAGLEKDQYHMLAVQHDEPGGGKHVHILVPRVDLYSGKSLNIAPPNWKYTYDPLRDALNDENGWARPDDINRKRRYEPQYTAYQDAADLRAGLDIQSDPRRLKYLITQFIEQRFEAGYLHNRADVLEALAELGDITRQGKDYISIRLTNAEKAIRLKGLFYEEQFDSGIGAKIEGQGGPRQANAGRNSSISEDELSDRARANRRLIEQNIEKRSRYNRQRYGTPEQHIDQQQNGRGSANSIFQPIEENHATDHRESGGTIGRIVQRLSGTYNQHIAGVSPSIRDTTEKRREQLAVDFTNPDHIHHFGDAEFYRSQLDGDTARSLEGANQDNDSSEWRKMGVSTRSSVDHLQRREQLQSALQENLTEGMSDDGTRDLTTATIQQLSEFMYAADRRSKKYNDERKRAAERASRELEEQRDADRAKLLEATRKARLHTRPRFLRRTLHSACIDINESVVGGKRKEFDASTRCNTSAINKDFETIGRSDAYIRKASLEIRSMIYSIDRNEEQELRSIAIQRENERKEKERLAQIEENAKQRLIDREIQAIKDAQATKDAEAANRMKAAAQVLRAELEKPRVVKPAPVMRPTPSRTAMPERSDRDMDDFSPF